MKYTSDSTETKVQTRKQFSLHDAPVRAKKFTKSLQYQPDTLVVIYEEQNGNVRITDIRVSGYRMRKDGTRGDYVNETFSAFFAKADRGEEFLEIAEHNRPKARAER